MASLIHPSHDWLSSTILPPSGHLDLTWIPWKTKNLLPADCLVHLLTSLVRNNYIELKCASFGFYHWLAPLLWVIWNNWSYMTFFISDDILPGIFICFVLLDKWSWYLQVFFLLLDVLSNFISPSYLHMQDNTHVCSVSNPELDKLQVALISIEQSKTVISLMI